MTDTGANPGEAATADHPADSVFLERFTRDRDQAAFAALLKRHGPMVLGVCRRVLQQEQDAEDAFQAVFCALARKAGTIRRGAAVGGWLYSVASRIARKMKARQVRHRVHTRPLPDVPGPDAAPEWERRDLWQVLDEEVHRLPERLRQPFVLCHLQGKTNREAAADLCCPPGTVSSRLARARQRLGARLVRRGLAPSAAAAEAALSRQAAPVVLPADLARTAAQTALGYAAGLQAGRAADLADSLLKSQALNRWVKRAGLVALAGVLAFAVLSWALRRTAPTDPELLQGTWNAAQVRMAGQPQPAEGMVMVFAADRGTLQFPGMPPLPFSIHVDPGKDPKQIDVGFANGRSWPGIYRLHGDRLHLCINSQGNERPTAFDRDRFFDLELQRAPAGRQ